MKKYILIILVFILFGTVFASKLPSKVNCIERNITAQNIKTKEIKKFTNTCQLGYDWIELGKKNTKFYKKKKKGIFSIELPYSKLPRIFVLLTKSKFLKFNNTTFKLNNVKKLSIKGYNIIIVRSNKKGKIFLSSDTSVKLYIVVKEGKKIYIKKINKLINSNFIKINSSIYKLFRIN